MQLIIRKVSEKCAYTDTYVESQNMCFEQFHLRYCADCCLPCRNQSYVTDNIYLFKSIQLIENTCKGCHYYNLSFFTLLPIRNCQYFEAYQLSPKLFRKTTSFRQSVNFSQNSSLSTSRCSSLGHSRYISLRTIQRSPSDIDFISTI
jgi:hypothetical protein